MAGSEEELKSLLRRVKEWKSWLKPQHSKSEDHGTQSHHFMANGEKVKAVIVFIFLASKITADGDCSHEIKRCLLFWKKAMTNLDSILKGKDITLLTMVCIVKVAVFPVVIYGRESWTIKKAESQIIDALELWCWRRLLRIIWTARRLNQSILKEISPEYSLERQRLKQWTWLWENSSRC